MKHESKKRDLGSESARPANNEVSPNTSRDPIEPDPMNPVQQPPTVPECGERPDLDWAEHED